jgi:pimeloyl-ACP methyl ester carboxylesterase
VTLASCVLGGHYASHLVLAFTVQRHGTSETLIGKAMAPFLLAGYNVLAIDLRNHGNSQDAKPISLGLHEVGVQSMPLT